MKLDITQTEKAAFFARLLAHLYQEPPDAPLLAELARLDLAAEWPLPHSAGSKLAFAALRKALAEKDFETLRQELRDEHMLLFIGLGMPLVPLWGSVFLNEENLLMGESTLKLEAFLADAGLGATLQGREPLDHLGLCLSALAVLLGRLPCGPAEGEAADRLKEFLAQHLSPWVPRCLELLAERAQSPFYRAVGELTAALLGSLAEAYGARRVKQALYY